MRRHARTRERDVRPLARGAGARGNRTTRSLLATTGSAASVQTMRLFKSSISAAAPSATAVEATARERVAAHACRDDAAAVWRRAATADSSGGGAIGPGNIKRPDLHEALVRHLHVAPVVRIDGDPLVVALALSVEPPARRIALEAVVCRSPLYDATATGDRTRTRGRHGGSRATWCPGRCRARSGALVARVVAAGIFDGRGLEFDASSIKTRSTQSGPSSPPRRLAGRTP